MDLSRLDFCRKPEKLIAAGLIYICIFGGIFAFAEQPQNGGRYMSRSLKNIDPAAAKQLLDELNFADVSHIQNTPTLLITGSQSQLTKASAVLNLIDRKGDFVITRLGQTVIPPKEAIERSLSGIEIGSFDTPPINPELEKAILDTLDDGQAVLIADKKNSEKILAAIESAKKTEPDEPNTIEPQETLVENNAKGGNDVIFGELVGAIEATDKMKELKTAAKPQPKAAEKEPEAKADNDNELKGLLAKLEQTEEANLVVMEPEAGHVIKSYEPHAIPDANGELTLNIPEQLQITDLLRLVGEYLHLDYMYDPAKVQGIVTLKVRGPIKVRELYPLMEDVLKFKGFVMTRRGNHVTIVPIADAAQLNPQLVDGVKGNIRVGDVIMTRIFELNYVSTDAAKNLLDQMKLSVSTTVIPETGTLIVTGYTADMQRIEELISLIDKPGAPKKFRFRQLKYTLATNLTEQLKQLVEQMGNISISVAQGTAATPTPAPARTRRPTPKPAATPAAQTESSGSSVYLDADERTNRILMIGLDDELDIVEELINSIDVPQKDLRAIRVYDIQHVGAEDVIDKLIQLGVISEGTTEKSAAQRGRITASRAARPGQPAQPDQPAQPEATSVLGEAPLSEEPQIVVLESTNSLLVNATPEQHDKIGMIIGYIDSEAEAKNIPYVVYPLENQDPVRLKEMLDDLISETTEEQSSSTPDQQGKIVQTAKRTKTTKMLEENISIVADPNTYSLIVYANKKNQQWISALIEQLDQYRPQVLLDCTLVEITQNERFEYDLDIIGKTYGSSNLISSKVGTQLNSFTNDQFGEGRSTTSTNPFDTTTAGLRTFKAFYDSDKIQGLLTAIQNKGYGRVMAKPKILVNDNQEGVIKTQKTTSVAQLQSNIVPVSGGTTSNAVTTTNISFKDYDSGVTLKIKPHISKGDMLRLVISLSRKDFDKLGTSVSVGDQTVPQPPDILATDVNTVSTLPNGTTVILGGLEQLAQKKGHSKIPILGDLPLVGGLFRGVNDTGTQSRLYVFVKASIIRPGDQLAGLEDIKRVSERNRKTFEELEERFQNQEDWPGIKPKPMDPVKVLEIDEN